MSCGPHHCDIPYFIPSGVHGNRNEVNVHTNGSMRVNVRTFGNMTTAGPITPNVVELSHVEVIDEVTLPGVRAGSMSSTVRVVQGTMAGDGNMVEPTQRPPHTGNEMMVF